MLDTLSAASPIIVVASRTFGALLFILALAGKLRAVEEFIGVVSNYRIVPEFMVRPLSFGVMALEGLIALSLVSGFFWELGIATGSLLLLIFALVIATNIFRGNTNIDCGCFRGAGGARLTYALVVRNVFMAAFLSLALNGTSAKLDTFSVLNGVMGGAAFLVLCLAFTLIVELRERTVQLNRRFS